MKHEMNEALSMPQLNLELEMPKGCKTALKNIARLYFEAFYYVQNYEGQNELRKAEETFCNRFPEFKHEMRVAKLRGDMRIREQQKRDIRFYSK